MSVDGILKLIKERKGFALWFAAIIVVSFLFIWALLSSGKDEDKKTDKVLFDTPLTADKGYTVTIPKNLYEEEELPGSLEVFDVETNEYSNDVATFLVSLGKGGLKKSNTENVLYIWSSSSDYVEYVPESQSLVAQFGDPVQINTNTQLNSTESGKQVLEYVYSNYLNKQFKFTNVKIVQDGKKYHIQGNRLINNRPLFLPDTNSYSDSIVVDDNSNLYEVRATLVEYEQEGYELVKLVHPSNLAQILKDANYPKEIFQGFNSQIAEDIKNGANTLDPSKGMDNVDGTEYDLPNATFASAKSVDLVYYYAGNTYKQLSPTYRIVGEGEIVVSGKKYSVPVIVFANALDPERVYVPE